MSRRDIERVVALLTNGAAGDQEQAAWALANLTRANAANKAEKASRKRRLEAPECVVCLERAREVAFVPCGHFCVCSNCGQRLWECPICRKSTRKQRIYT